MQHIRILFYDEGAQGETQLGGGQLERLELAACLNRDEFQAMLLTSLDGELAHAWRAKGLDVTVRDSVGGLARKPRSALIKNPVTFIRYLAVLRRARPILLAAAHETGADILHPNENFSRTVTALAKKNLAIPAVMHIDNIFSGGIADRILVRLYARTFDHFIAVSRFVSQPFIKSGAGNKLSVVYQGVDADLYRRQNRYTARRALGLEDYRIAVAIVGKLDKLKGHRYLFDAVGALERERERIRVLVAGTGPDKDALHQYAAKYGLSALVHFLGQCQNIPEILAAADIVVIPSLTEAMPRVLYEGMAAGKTIIATSVGGIPEILQDGKNGFLIPPASAAALSAALRTLIHDPTLRISLGTAAHETIQRFSFESAVKATEDIYRKVFYDAKEISHPPRQ